MLRSVTPIISKECEKAFYTVYRGLLASGVLFQDRPINYRQLRRSHAMLLSIQFADRNNLRRRVTPDSLAAVFSFLEGITVLPLQPMSDPTDKLIEAIERFASDEAHDGFGTLRTSPDGTTEAEITMKPRPEEAGNHRAFMN